MKELSIEEKELLLKDLSARLSYNVKVNIIYNKEHGSSDRLRICSEGCLTLNTDVLGLYIENEIYLKPYLRPMSSMTEEEHKELKKISNYYGFASFEYIHDWAPNYDVIDWLNAHHFDYRNLIDKGLALEALEGMY